MVKSASSGDIEPSVRLEQGFGQGSQIGVFYDPMIAKLVVHGRDRTEALRVLRKALDEYKVVGLSTNVEFLRTLAGNEGFIRGDVETGFIPVSIYLSSTENASHFLNQKHFDELFPPVPSPTAEALAQTALYVVLRDHPIANPSSSPWTSLASRRFGGDVHDRLVTLQTEDASQTYTVRVKSTSPGIFDITVNDTTEFTSIPAHLVCKNEVSSSVGGRSLRTTVVSQPPPPSLPASSSPNTMERLHVFLDGQKSTLVLPTPKWLLSVGGDVLGAGKGALKAPMPSLVVEVKVNVGDRVEKGQAVVVLESMKTETVLRAEVDGVVKALECENGEMVEEGRELVSIEADG